MIAFKSVLASRGESGVSPTPTIPDGKTVVPTDDIQIFLHCANIWDCTYTTLGELFEDTKIMANVFLSLNAVDYLIRCTTWMSDFCDSPNAIFLIASYGDSFFKLWCDDLWQPALRNSQYLNLAFMQQVPKMTSNTQPQGNVVFSSEYSNAYKAYFVFDGETTNNYWSTVSGNIVGSYIGYEFVKKVRIYRIDITFPNTNYAIKDFKIQYKNSQDEWVDIPNSDFTHAKKLELKTYFITPVESAYGWRVYVKSNNNSNKDWAYLNGLQFYGTL